jgi:hypothetical protein
MKPGVYPLSLGIPGIYPVPTARAHVDQPVLVRGNYVSYAGLRMAGWFLIAGSVALGGVLRYASTASCDVADNDCSIPRMSLLIPGVSTIVVGGIAGLVMALKDDAASVEIEKWNIGARKAYGATLARAEKSNTFSFPMLAWRTSF